MRKKAVVPLQDQLLKALTSLHLHNAASALKKVTISEKDHDNVLAFLKLLTDTVLIPKAEQRRLLAIYEICKTAPPEKLHTKNKLSK
jgi:hypothetical protein